MSDINYDIFRGTTPTIIATVEMDLTGYTCYLAIGRKANQAKVIASNNQMTITVDEGVSTLTFTLTQEQTLSLSEGKAYMQIRLIDMGVALASEWVEISVGPIIQDGVIEDVVD